MNKIYSFSVNHNDGGYIYIAAPTWKEARKHFMKTEWCDDSDFVDIRGHMIYQSKKNKLRTDLSGELEIADIVRLGLAWWECEHDEGDDICSSSDIRILDIEEGYEYGEAEYKCNTCGYVGIVPYIDR